MINFKEDVDPNDLFNTHKELNNMILLIAARCHYLNMKFVITSLITDRDKIASKSRTHFDGRAADIRIRDWTPEQTQELWLWINLHFRDVAAITLDGPVAARLKKNHIHLQVRP